MPAFTSRLPASLNQDPAPYIDKYGDRIDWDAEDAEYYPRDEFIPDVTHPTSRVITQLRAAMTIRRTIPDVAEITRYRDGIALLLHAGYGRPLPGWYSGPTVIPAYPDTDSTSVVAYVFREAVQRDTTDSEAADMLDHALRFLTRYRDWVANADGTPWPGRKPRTQADYDVLYAERAWRRWENKPDSADKASFIAGYIDARKFD
ncbi:hypothetical protein [Agromyces humi]|uniref:hypothetical protein n=1 Tax=Agromyces humi TaxID=1766800 RepID=UPI0013571C40|nr:hypothetical protein [Agromyces humi]